MSADRIEKLIAENRFLAAHHGGDGSDLSPLVKSAIAVLTVKAEFTSAVDPESGIPYERYARTVITCPCCTFKATYTRGKPAPSRAHDLANMSR